MALERVLPDSDAWPNSHADHLARYLFATSFVHDKRVLDAGAGPGYGAFLLASHGAREVVGIDIDPETVQYAQAKFGSDKVQFQVDDCELISKVTGRFDVICNFENIEHLQRPERFLAQAAQLLADDGVLLCSSPDLEGPYIKAENGRSNNPYHVNEWPREEFAELLGRYFADVDMRTQIESLSCHHRRIASQNLSANLAHLWSSPALRLTRAFRALFRQPIRWPQIHNIGIGAPFDYPIMTRELVRLFGVPYCHYAICRRPLVANSG